MRWQENDSQKNAVTVIYTVTVNPTTIQKGKKNRNQFSKKNIELLFIKQTLIISLSQKVILTTACCCILLEQSKLITSLFGSHFLRNDTWWCKPITLQHQNWCSAVTCGHNIWPLLPTCGYVFQSFSPFLTFHDIPLSAIFHLTPTLHPYTFRYVIGCIIKYTFPLSHPSPFFPPSSGPVSLECSGAV